MRVHAQTASEHKETQNRLAYIGRAPFNVAHVVQHLRSSVSSDARSMMMMWSIFNTILRPLCGFPPLNNAFTKNCAPRIRNRSSHAPLLNYIFLFLSEGSAALRHKKRRSHGTDCELADI
jgi:hypothetical protein